MTEKMKIPGREDGARPSPQEHYENLLKELADLDDAKYASVPPQIVAGMKEVRLKTIEAYKKEHPELNN